MQKDRGADIKNMQPSINKARSRTRSWSSRPKRWQNSSHADQIAIEDKVVQVEVIRKTDQKVLPITLCRQQQFQNEGGIPAVETKKEAKKIEITKLNSMFDDNRLWR